MVYETGAFYSAIHKAAAHRSASGWNDPQRPFPIDSLTAFSGIVPGRAGSGSVGSFVNSAVEVQFTNPETVPATNPIFRNCSGQRHETARNHEAGGFVNSAVKALR